MTLLEALTTGLMLGLASAAHCAGMCGAFALMAGRLRRALIYLAGKLFTYLFLGAIAGWLGASALEVSPRAQGILGLIVALGLLVAALGCAWPRLRFSPLGAALGRLLGPVVHSVTGRPRSAFTLGAMTGVLPCGVVGLGLLQGVTAGTPIASMAVMAGLGIGTGPVLLATALVGPRLLQRIGAARLRILGAVLLSVLAGLAIARSVGPAFGSPPCCH